MLLVVGFHLGYSARSRSYLVHGYQPAAYVNRLRYAYLPYYDMRQVGTE